MQTGAALHQIDSRGCASPDPVLGNVSPAQHIAARKEQRGGVCQQHAVGDVHVGRHSSCPVRKCCRAVIDWSRF